jgi:poly(A) polymerase
VGGSVRDLLLGREPKDFDVATNATPEQIKSQFGHCRLIGRRFRLAHVYFGRDIIETATFRGPAHDIDDEHIDDSGRILRDNAFGTIEEDAVRRDFSVNALFYDVEKHQIIDYVNGLEDLKNGLIRVIGDPATRYREDPVRMLRAIRFMAKLGFKMESKTEASLLELNTLLGDISPSRLFDETKKLFLMGDAQQTYELMQHYGLFEQLFPYTYQASQQDDEFGDHQLILSAMKNTDRRIEQDKPVTPAFLYAVLLWPAVKHKVQETQNSSHMNDYQVIDRAGSRVTSNQCGTTSIPKRFSRPMREIWALQPRFNQTKGKRVLRFLHHPRFRAAYDFMLLRAEQNEVSQETAEWWTQIQEKDAAEVKRIVTPKAGRQKKRPKR